MYAIYNDIALINETKDGVNNKLGTWMEILEFSGFRLSWSKKDYIECKFFSSNDEPLGEVTIGDMVVLEVERFTYLGSIVQGKGDIDEDIIHYIRGGRNTWG